jgi:ribosomal protein S18 acetylase RimI-like enzyme
MRVHIEAFSSSEVESLAGLSRTTFLESHGHSASKEDINHYINSYFNEESLAQDLKHSHLCFNKILVDGKLAGYSKLILNQPHPLTSLEPISKFERLYLLKDFYGLKLGEQLLAHNVKLAKSNHQKGMWLYVWTENEKAIKFYTKSDFKPIGKHDFKISEKHYNPNYVMLKKI